MHALSSSQSFNESHDDGQSAVVAFAHTAVAHEIAVPFGGNAFVIERADGSADRLRGDESDESDDDEVWADPSTVFAVYFHVNRAGMVGLALKSAGSGGTAEIEARVADHSLVAQVAADGAGVFGRVPVEPGYVKVEVQGRRRDGAAFARDPVLMVTPDEGVQVTSVRTNEGRMFHWGRRGPSVHLHYQLPTDVSLEYAYGEVTVPEGQDPIGSFFMANGFDGTYFGIQVKGPEERWVLFSVWSPFAGDNPSRVPAADRVALVAKGEDVRIDVFGNEGTGAKSVLVYPWQAGLTYRFLTQVRPVGGNVTEYASWFGPPGEPFRLMARFRRPRTDTHLTGFHSFLENFSEPHGHLGRRAVYTNQWVRDRTGRWHAVRRAEFTGDATAVGGHRLDYAGGLEPPGFFLRNGGFFADRVPLDTVFMLPDPPGEPPALDLDCIETLGLCTTHDDGCRRKARHGCKPCRPCYCLNTERPQTESLTDMRVIVFAAAFFFIIASVLSLTHRQMPIL